ncbi:MAG: DUF2878 domain-containing protein [Rhodanobacteraceae bacterium]|mgnify:FL=1|nr:DUF2878 domain-containing protein [Rhodanobacteraceae bacterium]MBL0042386.1 DUF2878 domain-containing protein [Xanthomonadales bacterium]
MNLIANAALFQVVWFATVAGAGAGHWWTGLPALAVFAIWQLRTSRWPRADAATVGIGILLGLVIDSILIAGGWLRYATPLPWVQLAPVWIIVLWAGFALTLNHSLAFLKQHVLWSLLFGAIGGPLAYLGAARLFNAVEFTAPDMQVVLALGIAWAIATPLLLTIASRLVAREPVPA